MPRIRRKARGDPAPELGRQAALATLIKCGRAGRGASAETLAALRAAGTDNSAADRGRTRHAAKPEAMRLALRRRLPVMAGVRLVLRIVFS